MDYANQGAQSQTVVGAVPGPLASRHPLSRLERDRDIPGQPKRLFRFLCEEAGLLEGKNVVGQVIITTWAKIAIELGRARTSAHEWTSKLIEAGLLRVDDEEQARTKRRQGKSGKKRFTILSLCPGDGWDQLPLDPQQKISFSDGANCRERLTEPDTPLSGTVDETRQSKQVDIQGVAAREDLNCREPLTEPDSRPHDHESIEGRAGVKNGASSPPAPKNPPSYSEGRSPSGSSPACAGPVFSRSAWATGLPCSRKPGPAPAHWGANMNR